MNEEKPDIELGPLGAGCLTSCLSAIVVTAVAMVLLTAAGIQLSGIAQGTIPPGIQFFTFLLGLAGEVLVGYVTARTASNAKRLHVLVLGGLMMVVGLLGIVLPDRSERGPDPYSVLHWLLTLPMLLLGAKIAIDTEK